jgi:hypothetical protein
MVWCDALGAALPRMFQKFPPKQGEKLWLLRQSMKEKKNAKRQ